MRAWLYALKGKQDYSHTLLLLVLHNLREHNATDTQWVHDPRRCARETGDAAGAWGDGRARGVAGERRLAGHSAAHLPFWVSVQMEKLKNRLRESYT